MTAAKPKPKRPDLYQRPLDLGAPDPTRDAGRWWAMSGRKDYCTPDDELELVRLVFGTGDALREIDLDPCSNPFSRTRAKREYMLERGENGLSAVNDGKEFWNPPYGVGEVDQFTARARMQALLGPDRSRWRTPGMTVDDVAPDCIESIGLIPANTETNWYHRDCATADAICFRRQRIQFRIPPDLTVDDVPWKVAAREILERRGAIDELRQLLNKVRGWERQWSDAERAEGLGNRSSVANLYVYWGPRPERFSTIMSRIGHAFVTEAGRSRL